MKLLATSLAEVARSSDRLALRFTPGPQSERMLKHLQVPVRGPVDVLVLGQSDADHVSERFFRGGVRFYNGFLSSACFAYQWEVFDQIVASGTAPAIVLWDVTSEYMLKPGVDPPLDAPPTDPVWFAGPPLRQRYARAARSPLVDSAR